MEVRTIGHDKAKITSFSANDVVSGGELIKDMPAPSVLVTAQTDLAQLPEYPAGTVAYTAGFKGMWQLNAAGEWVSVL